MDTPEEIAAFLNKLQRRSALKGLARTANVVFVIVVWEIFFAHLIPMLLLYAESCIQVNHASAWLSVLPLIA